MHSQLYKACSNFSTKLMETTFIKIPYFRSQLRLNQYPTFGRITTFSFSLAEMVFDKLACLKFLVSSMAVP
jgi:hypothetical protein